MPRPPKNRRDLFGCLRIDDANPLDEMAGTIVEQQKLCLFAFLDKRISS